MRKLVNAGLLLSSLILASCTTMDSGVDNQGVPPVYTDAKSVLENQNTDSTLGTGAVVDAASEADEAQVLHEKSDPTIYRGTDAVYKKPPTIAPVRLHGEAVSLNFEQAPLTEVVHAVLGDILEMDYVVEHPINGQVTLRTRTPIERAQLLDVLESLLKANSAFMIRDKDGRIFVSSSPQMKKLKPSLIASTDGAVGFSTLIVPLNYISASNMAEILTPVAEEGAFVRIDNMRNLLMLAGTQAQLEGWQDMIDTFDIDLLKGMSVGIFPIENAPIEDVEQALSAMMGKDGANDTTASLSGIGSVIRIIPVQRLSSIMVVTPRAHYLKRVETWIERLDRKPDANFEPQLYVYPVQNTSAGHLAGLLSTIFGGGGKGGSSSSSSGVAPGFTPETVSSGSDMGIAASGVGSGENSSGGGGRSASRTKNVTVGNTRIVADEQNNSLLIYATGKEYEKIKPALDRLDVAATQVIIEASIIEVTLNDSLQYGLEWTFNQGLESDYRGTGLLQNGDGFGANVPGFSYSVVNSIGDVQVVLNALAEDGLLNIISSPSVMVLDNQTATIEVGSSVPVLSGTSSNADQDVLTQNITYRDTGVSLKVTPSVNAGGMVSMTVDQNISSIDESSQSTTGNPTFFERNINSKVAVRSSETVVLGGLISENKSQGKGGVPVLYNLPLIGPLFGTTSTTSNRTELLIVITPRVIYSDQDLRDVSSEMRRQMRGLELIDVSDSSSFLGGDRAGQDIEAPQPENP